MSVRVIHADSREALKDIADCSIDSVATDPPYALVSIVKRFGKDGAAPAKSEGASGVYARASAGFMGQAWDTGETAFDPAFWAEVLRVLKPGGHLVACGGTRSYHRLVCAIEDAGFEIRDQLAWLYGSGFPKSHNIKTGDFTGWGTALKPALEPIVLARRPLISTVAANVQTHGTGALNVDACRVSTPDALGGGKESPTYAGSKDGWRRPFQDDPAYMAMRADIEAEKVARAEMLGRWPANVVHDGSEEVLAAFPESAGQQHGAKASVNCYGDYGARDHFAPRGDSGSAARFFYSAKADAEDRLGSKHPTVKPVDLMRWLVRLITPPGGTVLDPFAGTGTTGIAAMADGFDAVLIEREARFVADIERRIAWAKGEGRMTALEMARLDTPEAQAKATGADLPLFGGEAA